MELWRDAPGYEGLYQVSNYGRVKSLNFKCTGKEKIMKLTKLASGHLEVRLCKDGIVKALTIHRLVAQTFIPNPHNYEIVHHIDHNPQNNRVENLMWMSDEKHRGMHTRENKSKTVYQYTLDGELVAVWESAKEAAKELRYSRGDISTCCYGGFFHKGKWINITQHKGFRWSYVPL